MRLFACRRTRDKLMTTLDHGKMHSINIFMDQPFLVGFQVEPQQISKSFVSVVMTHLCTVAFQTSYDAAPSRCQYR